MNKNIKKKLRIKKLTVRNLSSDQLQAAQGGGADGGTTCDPVDTNNSEYSSCTSGGPQGGRCCAGC